MALKIILRPLIWYTHLYCECLGPYWFLSWLGNFWPSGGQKHLKGGVISSQLAKSFQDIFCTCFKTSVWNLAYTSSGWCHTSSSSFIPIWTLWPTLHPKNFQSHISGFKNYRKASDLVHTQIVNVLTPTDFCHAWAIFGTLVDKNIRKGELVELPASDTWGLSLIRIRSLPLKSFPDFSLNVLTYQLESWFIHWVGCTAYWVLISLEWDPCDLHVLSPGTVNWHGNHWCWRRAY